jgi:hypothetical protein
VTRPLCYHRAIFRGLGGREGQHQVPMSSVAHTVLMLSGDQGSVKDRYHLSCPYLPTFWLHAVRRVTPTWTVT